MSELKHIKEMKCPECGGYMKEYATTYRCSDKCCFQYLRFFPDDEKIRDLNKQIEQLNKHIEILKSSKVFKEPKKLIQVFDDE